jgi:phosphatidylglycerol lysyltransferase
MGAERYNTLMMKLNRRNLLIVWQILFILLSTTWLFAPALNHFLSYRTSLISQYETPAQPFSVMMRLADFGGGLLLLGMGFAFLKKKNAMTAGYLLIIAGAGMALDPIFTTTCRVALGDCVEYYSSTFVLHATETVITASVFFILGVYDAWLRKHIISIAFAAFQIAYFILFLTQYTTHAHYNTFSQFLYQLINILWAAWFCRDFLMDKIGRRAQGRGALIIKYSVAAWAFLNGILAIVISFADINLLGRIRGIYFAGDNAWLAQHSVIIGVILLYLSRHLARGERRARQIFLVIAAVETLKYSVITPNIKLLSLYLVTFCLLFVWRDVFDRGTIPLTWRIRAKELAFMISALLIAALISLFLLDSDARVAGVTTQAVDNFVDYSLRTKFVPKNHLQSVLLAHTISAFILISGITILWILFRPNKKVSDLKNYQKVKELLAKYSETSEDFFKLWPQDKNYFWNNNQTGFIAYRIAGPVVFALADPIAPPNQKGQLLDDFIRWARGRGLRVCFLPIYEISQPLYEAADLVKFQIGASAVIKSEVFLNETVNDKWWRWQKNKALKSGYSYSQSGPPHSPEFLRQIKTVSDAWLEVGGHQERGFALGYFNIPYLQKCTIHYLADDSGQITAFTNQLPQLRASSVASVDLLRYRPGANNSMPYLLSKTIETTHMQEGNESFDLGFVPFAAAKSPVVGIARILGAGRFSAKGLEQFKNKFDPQWQPNYLAYDGDLADLALIAINLEKAMNQD